MDGRDEKGREPSIRGGEAARVRHVKPWPGLQAEDANHDDI